jgi:hypothetical protein
MKLNLAQLRELMTDHGRIEMVFFDGEPQGLADLAWDLQPDTVVTRGATKTPEQHIPGTPIDEPWESCLTMGTQWQYKPTNESYMSGGEIIRKLVETRAKVRHPLLTAYGSEIRIKPSAFACPIILKLSPASDPVADPVLGGIFESLSTDPYGFFSS